MLTVLKSLPYTYIGGMKYEIFKRLKKKLTEETRLVIEKTFIAIYDASNVYWSPLRPRDFGSNGLL